jgi:AcrR family transcriptional regulator
MPKISAPTVAEHRAAQRAALVRAGEEILLDAGLGGFTPGSVTERAGLSRSSFYAYFPSKDDLLVAIAIDALERWDKEIELALANVEPGHDELRAFVSATMQMTAEGKHQIAGVLREADLAPSGFDDLMELHDALMRPVIRVLTDLGADTSMNTVALVQGVLGAGVDLVSRGANAAEVSEDVLRMLVRGFFA